VRFNYIFCAYKICVTSTQNGPQKTNNS